jgi:hypothetical protein
MVDLHGWWEYLAEEWARQCRDQDPRNRPATYRPTTHPCKLYSCKVTFRGEAEFCRWAHAKKWAIMEAWAGKKSSASKRKAARSANNTEAKRRQWEQGST